MSILFYLLIFFLGATLGSFGGVIIERAEGGFARSERKKIFGGRSFCPGCDGQTLTRWQLIPVFGRLMQGGKCFRCKQAIPGWYQIIEGVMGVVFVVITYLFIGQARVELFVPLLPHLLFWLLTTWLLLIILIADFFYYELNVYAWMILLVLQVIYLGYLGVNPLLEGVLGSVILGAVFLCIYLGAKYYATKKMNEETEGFGLGDVLMAFSIGLFLPLLISQFTQRDTILGVQLLFFYLVGSSTLGIIYFLIRKLFGNESEMMPFLPAMILMFRILILGGERLIMGIGLL